MKKITQQPHLEEWRTLYQAAMQIKAIAPWEWMEEINVLGVQNPETQELGFVSVMGMLGEYHAIGVYLGVEALYGFWDVQFERASSSPEAIMELSQLQASFEDRNALNKQDHDLIAKLGLKFRGKHAWPLFRSIRPGCVPWFLEPDDVRFLGYVLEQTADVAMRFKEDDSLLELPDDEIYLVRVARHKDDKLIWEDQRIQVPEPEAQQFSVTLDLKMLEQLNRLPQAGYTLEMDFFMMPTPVQEKGERPFFPYILLIVDAKSNMILGNEFFQPIPSLEAMYRLIPTKVGALLLKLGRLPQQIKVRSERLKELLDPLIEETTIILRQSNRLNGVDAAKESLFQFLGR